PADVTAKGYTIKAAGIVYNKTSEYENASTAKEALVLANNGKNGVVVKSAKTPGSAYALNITPDNDKTIWATGYVTVVKGGTEFTYYSADPKMVKVSDLVKASIQAEVEVQISDATLNGGMAKFVSGLNTDNADANDDDTYNFRFDVIRSGILYKQVAKTNVEAVVNDYTLDKEDVTIKEATVLDRSSEFNVAPVENKIIRARGFAEVKYDGYTFVFYSNDVKTADVATLEAEAVNGVNVELETPVFYNGKARFVTDLPEDVTINASGIIFDKNTEYANKAAALEALVLENGGKNNVVVKTAKTPDKAYALNVTPVEDKTVWARSYANVTDTNGNTFTIYSDAVGKKVSELFTEKVTAEVKVTFEEPELVTKDDIQKIRLVSVPDLKDNYEVTESGIIYDKNTVYGTTNEAYKKLTNPNYYNDADSNVKKKVAKVAGKAYALNVTPVSTKNPVHAVGFVTVTMNGYTATVYTAEAGLVGPYYIVGNAIVANPS
ncbi:MAG: hypothetical protein J5864_02460, partial [Oscillospiraceae bacterium]|nr:hypothetical protein [Oscillospiraceae bacterium]